MKLDLTQVPLALDGTQFVDKEKVPFTLSALFVTALMNPTVVDSKDEQGRAKVDAVRKQNLFNLSAKCFNKTEADLDAEEVEAIKYAINETFPIGLVGPVLNILDQAASAAS